MVVPTVVLVTSGHATGDHDNEYVAETRNSQEHFVTTLRQSHRREAAKALTETALSTASPAHARLSGI